MVEAILVIVVTAVLALLLFGKAQSAQRAALSSRCLMNLRTLSVGALAFMTDHDGLLLPNKNWCQASWDTEPGFRDYVGVVGRAPNRSAEYLVDTPFTCPAIKARYPEKFPNFLNRGYTVNMFAMRVDPSSGKALSPGRLSNIASLSRMWLFTEALTAPASSTFVTNIKANNSSKELMCYPHSDRQNVVFFDGSINSLSAEEFWNNDLEFRTPFWGNVRPY